MVYKKSVKKVIPTTKVKPCHVVLNNIQGLLDENGIYMVPGRSRKNLTCYRCFKKFTSAESLEVHKAEHEPESEEENVFTVSDSEAEMESESEEDKKKGNFKDLSKKGNPKSPSGTIVDRVETLTNDVTVETATIEYVPKPQEAPLQNGAPVVAPDKPKIITAVKTPEPSGETKKVPVLCNIQIRCLTCDILFTNSELLMKHVPLNAEQPCCFTCKVCSQSYTQPEDYLNHIMQHNTFNSSRYGYRGGSRKKPEFRCTYCRQEFEHRFLQKQHEETQHKDIINATKPTIPVVVPPSAPLVVVPVPNIVEIPKPVIVVTEPQKPVIVTTIPTVETTPKIDTKKSDTENSDLPKPKIWVIKEALMKSPEPPQPNVLSTPAEVSGVKRKLEEIKTGGVLQNQAKKGRMVNVPTKVPPPLSTPAIVIQPKDTTSSLTCDICFDVFQNRIAYDEHMVFHTEKKEVAEVPPKKDVNPTESTLCLICNLHFKSLAGLRRHQTCAHDIKKLTSYVCGNCSKIFSTRKGLNIHKASCAGAQ